MTRIVFLDFDGVLNTETDAVDASLELWTEAWLEPSMVMRLGRLVEESGSRVVVSSSWRQRRSIPELEQILAARGFGGGIARGGNAIAGVTPRLPRPPEGVDNVRAAEIAQWLSEHPEVRSFVILDDERDFGVLAAQHVWTDPTVGLTDANVAAAIDILEGRS
jgi:hypothetical protein